MGIDVTENYIRIRVEAPSKFIQNSFRTIKIGDKSGITSVVGKLKSDPSGGMKNQNFMFDKDNWSLDKAKKWILDHNFSVKMGKKEVHEDMIDNYYNSGDALFFETTGIKLLDTGNKPEIGDTIKFEMYLSTFDGKDRSGDTVMQGAFDEDEGKKLPLLLNHINHTHSLAGSLVGTQDEKGLKIICAFLVTEENMHEAMMLVAGHLDKASMGGSFDYRKNVEGMLFKDQYDRYVIEKVSLYEGSLVCCPDNMEAGHCGHETMFVLRFNTDETTEENDFQVSEENENSVSKNSEVKNKKSQILEEIKKLKGTN